MQSEKPQPNLSWPEGFDPHTHAIALLNRLFGKTDHAPVTIFIVENYIREELHGKQGSNYIGGRPVPFEFWGWLR